MADLPASVRIVEVGPRDGLQNEPEQIPTERKLAFIRALAASGLSEIEATSFVNPRAIPQLSDAVDVASALPSISTSVRFSALVPNQKGLERAIQCGVSRIAVFTAASDEFTRRNINMSVDESLVVFEPVVVAARTAGMTVRGYVSTAFVCPYAGEIAKERVLQVTTRLLEMGCDEVAVSDTIGAAVPRDIDRTIDHLLSSVSPRRIALHLHDTYGTALANVYAGLRRGVSTFDSSAGGLGGCPYARGASGNLATEDLVYFLDRMGIDCGVNLEVLASASSLIAEVLGRRLPSKQWQRLTAAN
ncbi:MAG: hydroxymethylglutaryl-CoA lyase [Phycisphaerae bacterium]|nr:hydroxymethylglutaryl-CoA lyase [Phycisphaerae bacterium]